MPFGLKRALFIEAGRRQAISGLIVSASDVALDILARRVESTLDDDRELPEENFLMRLPLPMLDRIQSISVNSGLTNKREVFRAGIQGELPSATRHIQFDPVDFDADAGKYKNFAASIPAYVREELVREAGRRQAGYVDGHGTRHIPDFGPEGKGLSITWLMIERIAPQIGINVIRPVIEAIPDEQEIAFLFRCPEKLKKLLVSAAKKARMSTNAFALEALRDHFIRKRYREAGNLKLQEPWGTLLALDEFSAGLAA